MYRYLMRVSKLVCVTEQLQNVSFIGLFCLNFEASLTGYNFIYNIMNIECYYRWFHFNCAFLADVTFKINTWLVLSHWCNARYIFNLFLFAVSVVFIPLSRIALNVYLRWMKELLFWWSKKYNFRLLLIACHVHDWAIFAILPLQFSHVFLYSRPTSFTPSIAC